MKRTRNETYKNESVENVIKIILKKTLKKEQEFKLTETKKRNEVKITIKSIRCK